MLVEYLSSPTLFVYDIENKWKIEIINEGNYWLDGTWVMGINSDVFYMELRFRSECYDILTSASMLQHLRLVRNCWANPQRKGGS